jgi:hypothetical protein
MKTKVTGDPKKKTFRWRGVKFTRRTKSGTGCSVEYVSPGYWVHPYKVRESGPYGQLTGIIKWIAHTPLDVPAPSGCFARSAEGHGDTPHQALEDSLKSAETRASKVAVELVQAMADINKLKEAA